MIFFYDNIDNADNRQTATCGLDRRGSLFSA